MRLIKKSLMIISVVFLAATLSFSVVRIGGQLVYDPLSIHYPGYDGTVSFNDDNYNPYHYDAKLDPVSRDKALTATFDIVFLSDEHVFRYSHGVAPGLLYGRSDFRFGRRLGLSEFGVLFSYMSFNHTKLIAEKLSWSGHPVYFDDKRFIPSDTSLYLRERLTLLATGFYAGAQLGDLYLSASVHLPFLTIGRAYSDLIISDGYKSVVYSLAPGSSEGLSLDMSVFSFYIGVSLRIL